VSSGRHRQRARMVRPHLLILLAFAVAAIGIVRPLIMSAEAAGGPSGVVSVPPRVGSGPIQPEQTLLITYGTVGKISLASAVVGVENYGTNASVVTVPSGVVANVPGAAIEKLGLALGYQFLVPAQAAVSDVLQTRVDGALGLTPDDLSRLVTAEGGIAAVGLSGQLESMDGPTAAHYASMLLPGESETTRLERFAFVLTGVAKKMPNEAALSTYLQTLPDHRGTATLDAIIKTLRGFGVAAVRDKVATATLPVIDVGGGITRPDGKAAVALGAKMFPTAPSVGRDGQAPRVYVVNLWFPAYGSAVWVKLTAGGLSYVGSGPHMAAVPARSQVQAPDGRAASLARARRTAAALGLPMSDVQVSKVSFTMADVLVVLGSDWHF
jgi:hypothetical protein